MEILHTEGYEAVYEIDSFKSDFNRMFKKDSGNRKRYLNWLDRRLHLLEELGRYAVETEGFEWLEGSDVLCCMRYPHSKRNPRIVYVYADGENIILLTAFMEKASQDYKAAIKRSERAVERLKEMGIDL